MAANRHQEALEKAAQLFDNGYSASYIHEKLLKEGFSAEEATASVEALTNEVFDSQATGAETVASSTRMFFVIGVVLLLMGLLLFGLLPLDWRILSYGVLLAGALLILFAAFRANS